MQVRDDSREVAGGATKTDVTPDRGQLVLVAGFALAVTFVALALLLNSAIYAENLATRETGGEAAGTQKAVSEVDASVGLLLTQVNTNNTDNATYSVLRTRFTESVANWTESGNRQLSVSTERIQVEVSGTTEGTRLVHTNTSRNWTSANGDVRWTLFRDVDADDIQWFELNVTRKSLNESTLDTTMAATLNSSFNVHIEDGSGNEWRVYLFEGAATGNVYTLVEEPGENFRGNPGAYIDFAKEACLVNDEDVEIDLWQSEVEGVDCQELSFVRNLSGPITVSFENTTTDPGVLLNPVARVEGEYDILVNTKNVNWGNFHPASADTSPFALTALTRATTTRSYTTEDVEFNGSTTVEPRTIGGLGAIHDPRVHFDVNDSSPLTSGADFTVNWEARDPDGDLAWVNVSIVDGDGDVVYTGNNSVSGAEADGSDHWDDGSADDDPYTITVRATDHDGNVADQSQEHDADGDNEEVSVL